MKSSSKLIYILFAFIFSHKSNSQSLPDEIYFAGNHQVLMGGQPYQGLYDHTVIKTMELTFNQPHFWDTMLVNYYTYTDLPATFQVDGQIYDSVGVRFRGATSFRDIDSLNKLSFNISMDYTFGLQRIDGYKTLNLNNNYLDNSMMKEYVYNTLARKHIPMPKVSYVWLKINGMDWGLYINLEQENKDYLKEWFMTNNGSFWRAVHPFHHTVPPPNTIGDGTAALCYLGTQDTTYQKYYTLRSSDDSIPWQRLINSCYQLSITNDSDFIDSLNPFFDIDKSLWMLATENIFSDDDSYVFKGRTDYCIYHEIETGRMVPIQLDGNSVMQPKYYDWSVYYHADTSTYPLLKNLLQIPSIKQRYLAHYRTLIKDYFDTTFTSPLIDSLSVQIDSLVLADTMKLMADTSYYKAVNKLKSNFEKRRKFLDSLPEFNVAVPVITSVQSFVNNIAWQNPSANDSVFITAFVMDSSGVKNVNLHFVNYYTGNFQSRQMYDNGTHGDSIVSDSIYSAFIPPANPGVMQFYIEAIANDSALTASYEPPGAEHNVYYYMINPVADTSSAIVINEIMAKNKTAVADSSNEFDDWIELYNNSGVDVDLGNYSITDDTLNYRKFIFNQGIIVPANGYLILWADEQHSQGDTHLNFKLSSNGEQLFLLNPQFELVDSLTFGLQQTDSALARVPNGTGNFIVQHHTFNANNNLNAGLQQNDFNNLNLKIYPNPADENVLVTTNSKTPETVFIYDAYGKCIDKFLLRSKASYNTKSLPDGCYTVQCMSVAQKFVVIH
ncbi:MAG: CotH kinase family protein [Bacteroidia bacterium]